MYRVLVFESTSVKTFPNYQQATQVITETLSSSSKLIESAVKSDSQTTPAFVGLTANFLETERNGNNI